ncbi:MAG TPA: YeiH family protein [Steroidobacteraceae bacterium]|nr:YeiH family protein [Steroidobacteraceae bacterium]
MNIRANEAVLTIQRHPRGGTQQARRAVPGILFTGALALLATWLGSFGWFLANGISVLTLAIVLGMVLGNTVYPRLAAASDAGVSFSKQTLLRAGIVLYGFRLTFQDVAHVGFAGVLIDSVVIGSTFALSVWAGTRFLGLDRTSAMLIGAGSSICGAAAVMATEPVVKGRAEQVTVAVSTVVVFGTVAIFLYPALFHWNARLHVLPVSAGAYGIYAGSTIHEVAQVVAAGRAVTQAAANAAVITKMVRVMMLAPFLILLSAYLSRRPAQGAAAGSRPPLSIPWFALGFIAVTAANSLGALPAGWTTTITRIDTFLLAMAMGALGLSTHASAIRTSGIKPLALAGLLFLWLIVGGLAINAAISHLLA